MPKLPKTGGMDKWVPFSPFLFRTVPYAGSRRVGWQSL